MRVETVHISANCRREDGIFQVSIDSQRLQDHLRISAEGRSRVNRMSVAAGTQLTVGWPMT